MKKSHLKKIIRSTLCEIVKEESDSEKLLNMKIRNPKTGDDIKLKSALAYDKSSQVYKVAKSTHDKAMQVIKKDSEKSSQDTSASEPTKEPSSETDDKETRIVKSRETAKEKLNQMPKEKKDAFEKANDEYDKAMKAFDHEWNKNYKYKFKDPMDRHNGYETYKPRLGSYAPKGSDEKEFKEFRKLKMDANQLTDTEEAEMVNNNDWNDVKAKSLYGLKTYAKLGDQEDYAEMFKKSDSEIEKGNITKDTLPKHRPTDSDVANSSGMHGGPAKSAKRYYDILINKAYDKNPDATKDALIKRTLDKEEEMKANFDKLNDLKKKMDKSNPSGWTYKDTKNEIEQMMGTSTSDLKFLQDKIGEKELASSIDKEKKEREYNKKSAVGKMLSKIGIGETMKKSELQSIIREEIQNVINEEFSNWKVTFTRAIKNKLTGDVKKGHVEVVKARGTSEAIKKACKKAGCEGAWMHVDVEVTKK